MLRIDVSRDGDLVQLQIPISDKEPTTISMPPRMAIQIGCALLALTRPEEMEAFFSNDPDHARAIADTLFKIADEAEKQNRTRQ